MAWTARTTLFICPTCRVVETVTIPEKAKSVKCKTCGLKIILGPLTKKVSRKMTKTRTVKCWVALDGKKRNAVVRVGLDPLMVQLSLPQFDGDYDWKFVKGVVTFEAPKGKNK